MQNPFWRVHLSKEGKQLDKQWEWLPESWILIRCITTVWNLLNLCIKPQLKGKSNSKAAAPNSICMSSYSGPLLLISLNFILPVPVMEASGVAKTSHAQEHAQ